MDERRSSNNGACTLVRDCHAEVLARRGYPNFHHQRISNISLHLSINRFIRYLYDEINDIYDNNSNDDDTKKRYILFKGNDGMYRLRSQVSLHLYTSSSPCGNASVKVFIIIIIIIIIIDVNTYFW